MKVLFINKFLNKETINRIPLGILYVSAMIKDKHETKICDPNRNNAFKVVKKFKPDIIAYSIRTGYHKYYIDLNRKLKEKFNFFSVFGGPHATFFPEIINKGGIDCVVRGEAENAFRNLLYNIEKKRDVEKSSNCWIKINNKIYKNPLLPLEKDLNKLPFPDRELLYGFPEIKYAKLQNFITSRGCPYNCTYCFNKKLKQLYGSQGYIRRRSVDNVIREIIKTKSETNFEIVHFEDNTFNLNKVWLREFAEKYPKFPFKCNIRANLLDEETAMLLKKANCISVTFAIESGNDRIRNEVYKSGMSREEIINCAKLLRKYGIRIKTENIIGAPTSTLFEDIETLDLNIKCKPNYSTVSLMAPLPGTEIHEIALYNNQLETTDFDTMGSYFDSTVLRIPNLKERLNLQKLFALVVAFPFLRKYIYFLISRKRVKILYSILYNLFWAYSIVFKIVPHKLTIKDWYWNIRRYFSIEKKY